MALQYLPSIKLHDSFVDRIRHRCAHVSTSQILDAHNFLWIALGDHELQFIVDVDRIGFHQPVLFELLEVREIDGRIDIGCTWKFLAAVNPATLFDCRQHETSRQREETDFHSQILFLESANHLIHCEKLVARKPKDNVGFDLHSSKGLRPCYDAPINQIELEVVVVVRREHNELGFCAPFADGCCAPASAAQKR